MRRSVIILVLVFAAAVAGSWYGWQLHVRRAVVIRHVPAPPQLGVLPAGLGESLAIAEAKSRSWRHASEGLVELSRLYHANGFYPEALRCYEGLQAIEPSNARWPHLQASIVSDFGRMDEALPLRRRTVTLAPDYIPARLRLADVLLKSNQAADSASAYAEVLRRRPGEPYALLGLARCDLAADNWSKARERLEEAVAKNQDFIGAMSLLVTVSEQQGDHSTAESLKEAIGRREFSDLPDPWLDDLSSVCFDSYRLSVSAAVASSAGNQAVALELLNRAIALSPDAGSYHRQAGKILLTERNYAAANAHLAKAVELNPVDSDAWILLVIALRGIGEKPAILNALLSALSHCPQSPGLHLEYARWLKSVGRIDEAIVEFRTGYALRPGKVSPLVELAGVYFSAKRNMEALAVLNLVLEQQPDHPIALATIALYAISRHDETAALQRWEQIRRQPKTPPEMVQGIRQAFLQQFGHPLP